MRGPRQGFTPHHFFSKKSGAGFTMIELLVSIAILGLMLAIGIPSYASLRQNVALGNTADEIASALRLAQSSAMASQGGTAQGVHFTASQYCLFSVSTCSAAMPTSCPSATTTYALGGYGIAISGVPLDVCFDRLSGTTTAKSIVVGISGGSSKTISVTTVGKITVQ